MTISLLEKLNERASIEVEVYKLIFTYRKNLIHFTFIFFSYNCFLKNLFTRGLKVFVSSWCASWQLACAFCECFQVLDNYVTLFFCWCSLIFSAFVGTALAFACFSGAALVARRREYLYLGGLVSSGLSILLWLHFASSIFGGSTALFKFEVSGCHYSLFVKLAWGSLKLGCYTYS